MDYSTPPPIRYLPSERDYRDYFANVYCSSRSRIVTFDGIRIYFSRSDFDHAFFESSDPAHPTKDVFSTGRAYKIDWIKWVLENPKAVIRQGWDSRRRQYTNRRRVALHSAYVVVIIMKKNGAAKFVTAYPTGERTYEKIMQSPEWK